MPMFYFHVRRDDTRFEDTVGIELPDLHAAWQRAHFDARSIAKTGQVDGDVAKLWMEVGDATGAIVATLPFVRALATH
jgi:hypothetical protein